MENTILNNAVSFHISHLSSILPFQFHYVLLYHLISHQYTARFLSSNPDSYTFNCIHILFILTLHSNQLFTFLFVGENLAIQVSKLVWCQRWDSRASPLIKQNKLFYWPCEYFLFYNQLFTCLLSIFTQFLKSNSTGKVNFVRLNIFCGYLDSNPRSPLCVCGFTCGVYHSVCKAKEKCFYSIQCFMSPVKVGGKIKELDLRFIDRIIQPALFYLLSHFLVRIYLVTLSDPNL